MGEKWVKPWVRPEVVLKALDVSPNTLRRLRKSGRLVEGPDYLQIGPTCFRYNLPAVMKALGATPDQPTG